MHEKLKSRFVFVLFSDILGVSTLQNHTWLVMVLVQSLDTGSVYYFINKRARVHLYDFTIIVIDVNLYAFHVCWPDRFFSDSKHTHRCCLWTIYSSIPFRTLIKFYCSIFPFIINMRLQFPIFRALVKT